MSPKTISGRRYDIDGLRSLAFLLLIFYHIGMYYVADWGWHIKSQHTYEWLQELMILTNPWRMSLLFFISAVALSFVLQKYPLGQLLSIRSKRLMIPLLCGMFIVVVPQVYIEARSQDLIEPGYWAFWWQYINPNTDLLKEHHSSIGLLTWNHLWFLPYLWLYSCLTLLAVYALRNRLSVDFTQPIPTWMMLLAAVAVYALIRQVLGPIFPSTHGLTDDWYNHARYFWVFVLGLLFARNLKWWNGVIQYRRLFLIAALCGYGFIVADRNGVFETLAALYPQSAWVRGLYNSISSINHWAWIFAALGYSGAYLNRPAKWLTYCNEAILPWYMFHQTVIIVLAWLMKPYAINGPKEFLLITFGTLLACGLGYEIVKRFKLTRWLFGLKSQGNSSGSIATQTAGATR